MTKMSSQRSLLAVFIAIPVVVAIVAVADGQGGDGQTAAAPIVASYNRGGIYSLGEKVGWTLEMPKGARPRSYTYTIKKNNQELVSSGTTHLSDVSTKIDVRVDTPTMLYMQLTPVTGGRGTAYGAVVAPTQLKPVAERPKDFDAFWKSKIKVLKAIPENPILTPGESGKPDVEYATIKMDHVNGGHVYGQLAKPSKPGKYPALLLLQWASPPYPLQRAWVVDRAAQGFLTLNIEPHDVPSNETPAYYAGLPASLKNYTAINQEDRDKNYFVEMYLRDYRAVDYLASRPDWDGKTLIVMGTSMGGQQSLCVAGLHPKITHVIVNEPSGCDMNASLHGRQLGYPNFPADNPKAMETARYIDAINFASHIKATSLVAMGFVDTVAPPTGIWTAFNQIRGPKEAAPMFDSPHNNLATPEQQRPFTSRSEEWLNALAHGQKVTPVKLGGK